MSWQGYVRAVAQDYEHVICFGPVGHQALYMDFAKVYTPIVNIPGVKDCWRVEKADKEIFKLEKVVGNYEGMHLTPRASIPISSQKFIKFGSSENAFHKMDVLLHVRKAIGKRKNHAWHPVPALQLVEKLSKEGYSVAVIGTHEAEYIPGTVDLRNIELGRLMDVISAAKVVVGPSSGPMHLASLCGTPHIVWTDKKYYSAIGCTNRQRYEKIWNPFNTPVEVIDSFDWSPPMDVVMASIRGMLCKHRRRLAST